MTVSDKPGAHDPAVLRALALPDGTTLIPTAQARVAADCLFADVSSDGTTALKLAAPNGPDGAVLGMHARPRGSRRSRGLREDDASAPSFERTTLARRRCGGDRTRSSLRIEDGISRRRTPTPPKRSETGRRRAPGARRYNVQGSGWSRAERRFAFGPNCTVSASFKPRDATVAWGADVRGKYAAYRFNARTLEVLDARDAARDARLEPGGFELVALRRIATARSGAAWAPLGLLDMLNAGGAVVGSSATPTGGAVAALGPGAFGFYASEAPSALSLDGAPAPYTYDEQRGLLTVRLDEGRHELKVEWG